MGRRSKDLAYFGYSDLAIILVIFHSRSCPVIRRTGVSFGVSNGGMVTIILLRSIIEDLSILVI